MEYCPFNSFPCNASGSTYARKPCNTNQQWQIQPSLPSAYHKPINGYSPSLIAQPVHNNNTVASPTVYAEYLVSSENETL